ncbi:MAG: hypothetical protein NVS2B6_14600 [Thermoleophilaceae bacterium]
MSSLAAQPGPLEQEAQSAREARLAVNAVAAQLASTRSEGAG